VATSRTDGSWLFTVRVALVLAALLPPLRLLLSIVRGDRARFVLVQRCARAVMGLAGCRVHVRHLDRVPDRATVIFVSNHLSVADAAILLAVLPFDFRFVANHVYAAYAVLGAAIRAASAHIVNRESWRSRADSGQTMVDSLQSGQSLLVFPEGGMSPDGRLRPFKNGAFRAAARTGRSIVPIALTGTRELVPPEGYRLRNVTVMVDVLPPIAPADDSREGIATLNQQTWSAIHRHLSESAQADD
jgi:1-acyl-sn-glycerol-3-phosphate acyltransferase